MAKQSLPLHGPNGQKSLSNNLTQARAMEEHYRGLLLFWKSRRQRLEAQIPLDDPFKEFLKGLCNDA
jgi:hypothetical protein